jgi:hypothetical protein
VSRRSVVLLAVLLCALAAARGPRAAPAVGQTGALASQRALAVYDLIQRYFYRASSRSYAGTYPPQGRGEAQVWPYSQAFAATLALTELPIAQAPLLAWLHRSLVRLAAYRAPLARYLAYSPIYGGHGNVFYDDNVWVGLELVEAAGVLHDRAALTNAARVFRWIETGWDTSGACPGGVYWLMPGGSYWNHSPRNRYRAAVSTVNAALLGALLYQHTGALSDLRFAKRAYAWTQRCLGEPDGLIADHIDADGAVDPTVYSYNEGALVAAGLRLYAITRAPVYLDSALRTARAALARFSGAAAVSEPASFLAIFYGDLFPLIGRPGGAAITRALAAFAARAWALERDPSTGLFHFGHTAATLLDQAAMVQVYAELART